MFQIKDKEQAAKDSREFTVFSVLSFPFFLFEVNMG
jgi:hypothetical protein